jgi:hypothetical protein
MHRLALAYEREQGLGSFPAAELAGPELDVRLSVNHRERLVRHWVGLNNTMQ